MARLLTNCASVAHILLDGCSSIVYGWFPVKGLPMITWSDTIDITCEMFQINQQQLASYLNISESALSRIRHGKARALFDSNAVFNNVFNPHTKGSPASNKNEDKDALLTLLKEIIEHSFPKAREAMADCWNGTDYQTFVLRLLGRTRQRSFINNGAQISSDGEEVVATSDIVGDKDGHRKQKRASLGETPSEQMSDIFEQTVADYNIATYICKVSDYLCGEPFYSSNAFSFIDAIQTNILARFISQQNDKVFEKISEFSQEMRTYSGFLGMVRVAVSKKYGIFLKACGFNNEIFGLIENDRGEMQSKLSEEPSTEDKDNKDLITGLEEELSQLDFISSILLAHKRLCELYGEICPGKRMHIF